MLLRMLAGIILVFNEERDTRITAIGATLIGTALTSLDKREARVND